MDGIKRALEIRIQVGEACHSHIPFPGHAVNRPHRGDDIGEDIP